MRFHAERGIGNAVNRIGEQIQVIVLVARISRCADREGIAQRFLRRSVSDTAGQTEAADAARQLGIKLGKIGGVSAARVHVPGDASIQRAFADRQLVTGDQIEFGVGAAKGAPSGEVRSPCADVKAARMADGDPGLRGDAFVRLRNAAETVIGGEGGSARNRDGRFFFFGTADGFEINRSERAISGDGCFFGVGNGDHLDHFTIGRKSGRGKAGDECNGRSSRGETNGHKERSIERVGSFHLRAARRLVL